MTWKGIQDLCWEFQCEECGLLVSGHCYRKWNNVAVSNAPLEKVTLLTSHCRRKSSCDPIVHVPSIVYLIVTSLMKGTSVVIFTQHSTVRISYDSKSDALSYKKRTLLGRCWIGRGHMLFVGTSFSLSAPLFLGQLSCELDPSWNMQYLHEYPADAAACSIMEPPVLGICKNFRSFCELIMFLFATSDSPFCQVSRTIYT